MKLLKKFLFVILKEADVEGEIDKKAARSNETFSGAYFFFVWFSRRN